METWEENQKYILEAIHDLKSHLNRIETRVNMKTDDLFQKVDIISDRSIKNAEKIIQALDELEHNRIRPIEIKLAQHEGSKSMIANIFSTSMSILAVAIAWWTAK